MTRAFWCTAVLLATVTIAAACAHAPAASSTAEGAGAGEQLYRSHCGSCHRLHAPGERTREEWAAQVSRMATRAHLSGDERARVLSFLQAHAKDSR